MFINHQGAVSMTDNTAHKVGFIMGAIIFLIFTLLICYALIPVMYGNDYKTIFQGMHPIEINLVQGK